MPRCEKESGGRRCEAYPSLQSLHAVPVLSFCIDKEETKQLHWEGERWGEGQSREGRKKENLGTGDYRLGESGPGWLALGALGSRARLTLMVSDQTDRVGARPGRQTLHTCCSLVVARTLEHRRNGSSLWTFVAFSRPGETGLFLLPRVTQARLGPGTPQDAKKAATGRISGSLVMCMGKAKAEYRFWWERLSSVSMGY